MMRECAWNIRTIFLSSIAFSLICHFAVVRIVCHLGFSILLGLVRLYNCLVILNKASPKSQEHRAIKLQELKWPKVRENDMYT